MVQKYTFTYFRVDDIDIKVDIYLPERSDVSENERVTREDGSPIIIPSVVFFHGGGLTAGDREFFSWHFHDQVIASSLSTKLKTDIKNHDNGKKPDFEISETLFAVAGSSAGAYPARLACLYANPKPKAFFSLYGTGGDLLSPFYIRPPLVSGWESGLRNCRVFMAPTAKDKEMNLPGISGCPIDPFAGNGEIKFHQERVWNLYVKMLDSGTYLDHLMKYPGLGQMLLNASNTEHTSEHSGSPPMEPCGVIGRGSPSGVDDERIKKQRMQRAIPQSIRHLFPQLHITKDFPPTYLVHGTNDRAVECRESREMAKRLCEVGVKCEIVLAGGLSHGFDIIPQPYGTPTRVLWDRYGGEVVPFLKRYLVETPGQ